MNNLRRIFVAIIIITAPALLLAQSNPLDSYIEKYAGQDGFYYLNLETNMSGISGDEDEESDFSQIIYLRMLLYEEGKSTKFDASKIYQDFKAGISKDEYRGLMEVKSNGENVEMMVKKNGDKLSEVIIVMQEEGETTLIAASGNFDLKDLAKFGNMDKCKGLKVLGELCDD